MLSLITPQSLKDLVDANAISHATVIADKDVYKISVKYGTAERLVSVRSREGQTKERVFTSLDAVSRFMRERVHLTNYDVDDSNFQPGAKRVTRPDTSVRLRDAHAARTHAEWMNEKAAESLADTRPNMTHESVMSKAQAVINAKRKQHASQATA